MNLLLINKTATFIDDENNMFVNNDLSKGDIDRLKSVLLMNAEKDDFKKMVLEIIQPKLQQAIEEVPVLEKQIFEAKDLNEKKYIDLINDPIFSQNFEIEIDGQFHFNKYENSSNVKVPTELLDQMLVCVSNKEDLKPFVNFWELCLYNEDSNARDGAFKFIKKQKLIITPNGYIVCYRRAVVVKDNKEESVLLNFVSSEVLKVKTQKKSIKKYFVVKDKKNNLLSLEESTQRYKNYDVNLIVGNLNDLYTRLQNSHKYSHTLTDERTREMRFGMGSVVSIDREKCDSNPNIECSSGLHIGSKTYVKNNNSFGSAILLCLVNPANIVSVPYSDAHKMRVCEYKIIGVFDSFDELEKMEESNISVLENDYLDFEIQKIEEVLSTKQFQPENLSNKEELITRLESAKKMLVTNQSNLKVGKQKIK